MCSFVLRGIVSLLSSSLLVAIELLYQLNDHSKDQDLYDRLRIVVIIAFALMNFHLPNSGEVVNGIDTSYGSYATQGNAHRLRGERQM